MFVNVRALREYAHSFADWFGGFLGVHPEDRCAAVGRPDEDQQVFHCCRFPGAVRAEIPKYIPLLDRGIDPVDGDNVLPEPFRQPVRLDGGHFPKRASRYLYIFLLKIDGNNGRCTVAVISGDPSLSVQVRSTSLDIHFRVGSERLDMDEPRAFDGELGSVARRTVLGATGSLVLAALAGCTTTEKPKGTLIEGDGSDGGGDGETTIAPETPPPKEVFSVSDTNFGPNENDLMTFTATVMNTSDERWMVTFHANLELTDPVTPEGDEESVTPTPLAPRDLELTREIDLESGESQDLTMTFDVTQTTYLERYRSISFGTAWSDLERP
ncbi:MAG: hypothetical protein ACI8VE_000185 [Natrialbaceae archaeon]|jgi:hypothetical protein